MDGPRGSAFEHTEHFVETLCRTTDVCSQPPDALSGRARLDAIVSDDGIEGARVTITSGHNLAQRRNDTKGPERVLLLLHPARL